MSGTEQPPEQPKKRPGESGAGTPWQKGQSGNPGGRPKLPDWMKERGPKALAYIADVADGTEPAEPDLRLKAAHIIVERYYGKAPQAVEVEGSVSVTPLAEALLRIAQAATPTDEEG